MNPIIANDAAISLAVDLLKAGALVAFPTETVYGLGADASNPDAVRRIFAAKGRPVDHPLIVHIPTIDSLEAWALSVPDTARHLAAHFWPGPLAMILKKRPEVSLEVTGGQDTVGLRMPDHPVALQLLQAFGGGVAAPSANRFCRISPTLASHVQEELGDAVDMILDGGACQVGVESTIIDLSGDQPMLLRPGHITREQIEAVLQCQLLVTAEAQQADVSEIRAPGMMAIHYAPTTPSLLCSTASLPASVAELVKQGKKLGLLTSQTDWVNNGTLTAVIAMPIEADAYAQNLYSSLRDLDRLNLDIILVEQPPQAEKWRAINDRLAKATSVYSNVLG